MSSPAPEPLPPIAEEIQCAETLPARAYIDPAIFAAERRFVFSRTWQAVAAVERLALPGQQLACQVAGSPIVVLRDEAGRLRGFHDVCRHRAGPLTSGAGSLCQRRTLQCRYHGWTYGLDGRLLHTPGLRASEAEPGGEALAQGFRRADFSLIPVEIATFGPLIFARLSPPQPPQPAPQPLVDQLGELVGETARYAATAAVLCERREYLVECNWKVYVDNYLEGYHIPPVHPALLRELDYPAYRVEPRGHHSRQYAPIRPLPAGSAGERSGAEREYSPTEGDGAAAYYWVFPNLMLNYYPDHLQINIVQPLAVDRTLVVFEWYFAERLSEEQKHRQLRRIAFSDTVQQEDAAICQAVQERLRAGVYDRGRFVPGHEDGVHHFQRLLLRYLQGG